MVHHKGISVNLDKATAIVIMKRPTIVRELKSFLGRVSYIRRFIPSLASVTNELSKRLKKELNSHGELSNKMPFKSSNRS